MGCREAIKMLKQAKKESAVALNEKISECQAKIKDKKDQLSGAKKLRKDIKGVKKQTKQVAKMALPDNEDF